MPATWVFEKSLIFEHSFEPSSNPIWPAIICVYHPWDIVREVVAEDFGRNFGTKINKNSSIHRIYLINSLVDSSELFCILALPYQYHNSDAAHAVKAQGTAVTRREKHISNSCKPCITLLVNGLKFCLDELNSINTAQLSQLQLPLRNIFAFGEGATLGFWVCAFWTTLSRTHRNSLYFVRKMLCDGKIGAQLEDSSHFISFLVNCHHMLLLGSQ